MPLADASVDVVVSGLVLNFVTDIGTALEEVARVAVKGATFGAYVWDYADKMELVRYFWDAATALDAAAVGLDEGMRFPLCRQNALLAQVSDSGFRNVVVTAIDVATRFSSFRDYWEPFLGGQGPAPAYAMSLDESARRKLETKLHEALPIQADGSISLIARAWSVRAIV